MLQLGDDVAVCPKCSKRVKYKDKTTGMYWCKRHGPVRRADQEKLREEINARYNHVLDKELS